MNILITPGDNADIKAIAVLTHAARPDIDFSEDIIEEKFQAFFSENPSMVVQAFENLLLKGIMVLYPKDPSTIELNPGYILGGYPVISPDIQHETITPQLITETIKYAQNESFRKLEFSAPLDTADSILETWYNSHPFEIKIRYVEMSCNLKEQLVKEIMPESNIKILPLQAALRDDLYKCYYKAFNNGDAIFFFEQDELEKSEYFNTLGYEEALQHPGSMTLYQDEKLIGFSFVLSFGEANSHISCMCIDPNERGKGLGSLMLQKIMQASLKQGNETITLGTETGMAAYHLYKKFGFTTTDGSAVGICRL